MDPADKLHDLVRESSAQIRPDHSSASPDEIGQHLDTYAVAAAGGMSLGAGLGAAIGCIVYAFSGNSDHIGYGAAIGAAIPPLLVVGIAYVRMDEDFPIEDHDDEC